MKIKPEHLAALTKAINKVREAHPDATLQAYVDNGIGKDTETRWRWDLFHASRKFMNDSLLCGGASGTSLVLYDYMNDSHIDTALRFILKDELLASLTRQLALVTAAIT